MTEDGMDVHFCVRPDGNDLVLYDHDEAVTRARVVNGNALAALAEISNKIPRFHPRREMLKTAIQIFERQQAAST